MDASELLRQGKLNEALQALQNQIRSDPSNAKLRVFLFQLLCVMGQWDRALTQLNTAAGIDPKSLLMKEVCQQLVQCEALRKEIFAGKKMPLVFGQPQEWVGWMIQANQQSAQGHYREAQELRERALEAAPAIAGHINATEFEWVADADPRLGQSSKRSSKDDISGFRWRTSTRSRSISRWICGMWCGRRRILSGPTAGRRWDSFQRGTRARTMCRMTRCGWGERRTGSSRAGALRCRWGSACLRRTRRNIPCSRCGR